MINLDQMKRLIFSQVDFPAYLEQDIGSRLRRRGDSHYDCRCPFPYHKDSNPSFSIDYKNGGWVWFCYGCSAGGTTVDFFRKYYGETLEEAIAHICNIFSIEVDFNAQIKAMIKTEGSLPTKKHIESDHLLLSQICFSSLKDYLGDKEVFDIIKNIYKKANEALEKNDENLMKELIYEAREISS